MIVDPKDLRTVFNLKTADVTRDELFAMFAIMGDNNKAAIEMNAKVIIDDKFIKENNSRFALVKNYSSLIGTETTVGKVVVHLYIFDIDYNFDILDSNFSNRDSKVIGSSAGNLLSQIDFLNKPLTKKVAGALDAAMAEIFVDGVIHDVVMEEYINRNQWLGYTTTVFTMPSLSTDTINPPKNIRNYRDKIIKDNKDVFDTKDLVKFAKLEKDVLNYASTEMDKQNVNGKLIYDSGFNGVWTNNFKVTSIWRGIAPKSDDMNQYDIVTSNLSEGIAKQDIASHADLAVLGAAGRAKDTQLGGYKTKIFNAAFASVVADKAGSDCKSTGTITKELTEANFKDYRYRYILNNNGSLTMIEPKDKAKYIGRTVKLRSSLYCTTRWLCSKCIGEMSYKLKIRNIGLHTSRVTSSLMNASMKAFHDMSVAQDQYDLTDYITPL